MGLGLWITCSSFIVKTISIGKVSGKENYRWVGSALAQTLDYRSGACVKQLKVRVSPFHFILQCQWAALRVVEFFNIHVFLCANGIRVLIIERGNSI